MSNDDEARKEREWEEICELAEAAQHWVRVVDVDRFSECCTQWKDLTAKITPDRREHVLLPDGVYASMEMLAQLRIVVFHYDDSPTRVEVNESGVYRLNARERRFAMGSKVATNREVVYDFFNACVTRLHKRAPKN